MTTSLDAARLGACWPLAWVAALASLAGVGPVLAEPPRLRPEVTAAHVLSRTLNEAVHAVPIAVSSPDGATADIEFTLTTFRPAGPGPFPVVVFNHGRGPDNSYPSRFRFSVVAEYFVRRGFAVLVPTRVGYGGLGSAIDPEAGHLRCDVAAAERQIDAVRRHVVAALQWAGRQAWADPKRVVIAGGSVGGYTSLAVAPTLPSPPVAVINFAGGSGGNPKRRPGAPCNPERISSVLAKAAKGGVVPSLWIYAENDRYWGAKFPREWHQAYVGAGGRAEFHMLGPIGLDGHDLIGVGFQQWRPIADRFFARLGYPVPRVENAPQPSGFAALDSVDTVPVNAKGKSSEGYPRFLRADVPRAFVVAPNGAWAYVAGRASALQDALARCQELANSACKPYAVDDAVVWRK